MKQVFDDSTIKQVQTLQLQMTHLENYVASIETKYTRIGAFDNVSSESVEHYVHQKNKVGYHDSYVVRPIHVMLR